ncbi:sugar-binding transcriptional regulator [Paenibacillus tyrfis]|uniref:Transcriptional regulator n=1 Tax=Paenibacillus tyrfis TaxID=1501230 RepID=A0A081NSY7_9BACL|nr:sugar-binding transcriptional regulator [Paenibacillus tyrfis]KEQ21560.1 transcriptional regulator [Paenibacillus tyrfis]
MMTDGEKKFLLKICRMYYFDELTQAEIAKKVGVSRPIISKGLQRARSEGLVEIIIHDDAFHTIDLEQQIENAFSVEDVIVVPTAELPPEIAKNALAKEAASYVVKQLKDVAKVGVSWGTSLHSLVKEFPGEHHEHLKVIPLVGGMGSNRIELHSNQIAYELSKKLNCSCESLYAPAIVESEKFRELLLQTPAVSDVLEEARKIDLAIVGIGNPFIRSTMEEIGYIGKEELKNMEQARVVGDINSCFVLADGSIAKNTINERVIGINVEELRNVKKVVAVTEGIHKVDSILATLRGGYINTLITDERTASELVKKLNDAK